MGTAIFYHLTRRPLAETLMMLLGKSREAGWNVVVQGRDRAAMEALDAALWQGPDDGFLPHGLDGTEHDADQPVLLTTGFSTVNAPQCLMSVHGAEISADVIAGLERACILFDGQDEAAVAQARQQWKALSEAGVKAQYWSEESGRWEMKAGS